MTPAFGAGGATPAYGVGGATPAYGMGGPGGGTTPMYGGAGARTPMYGGFGACPALHLRRRPLLGVLVLPGVLLTVVRFWC